MKSFLSRAALFLVAVSLVGGSVGCSKKPKNLTPLPAGQSGAPAPTDSVPFDGTGGTSPGAGRLPGSENGVGGTDLNNTGSGLGSDLNPNLDSRNKLENREIFANDNVYFDFDKFNVKPQYTANINKVADYLKAHPTDSLLVEGHTDDRGTEEYNLALGERRALSVRDRLVSAGVSGDRITTISYGKEKPAVIGNTEEAHAKNRRGVFVLLSNPAAIQ